jgi:rubrerythrin
LKAAGDREQFEHTKLYPGFANVAKDEGFPEVAAAFRAITIAERAHEAQYRKLQKVVEEGKVFKKDQIVRWKCRNCGYIHEGKSPPPKCPACEHPESFFVVVAEEEQDSLPSER